MPSHRKLIGFNPMFPGFVNVRPVNALPCLYPVRVRTLASYPSEIFKPVRPRLFEILTGTSIISPAFALALPTATTGIAARSATIVISPVTIVSGVTTFPFASFQPLKM